MKKKSHTQESFPRENLQETFLTFTLWSEDGTLRSTDLQMRSTLRSTNAACNNLSPY